MIYFCNFCTDVPCVVSGVNLSVFSYSVTIHVCGCSGRGGSDGLQLQHPYVDTISFIVEGRDRV